VSYSFAFEKLEVWQLSRQFLKQSYSIIEKFPEKEKFNLVDQIRRAVTSIVLNLAEMTSRNSYKEQAHFSEIAFGSAIEVYCAFLISYDLGYINDIQMETLKCQLHEITNKINALKNSQYKRANAPTNKQQSTNNQPNK
jgi:four helix bundle protein